MDMDNLKKSNFLKSYAAAEEIWNSTSSTNAELADAWRTQRALLLATTGNDPIKQYSILKRHYNKLNKKLGVEFQEQIRAVDEVGKKRKSTDFVLIEAKKERTTATVTAKPTTSQTVATSSNKDVDVQCGESALSLEFRTARQALNVKNLKNSLTRPPSAQCSIAKSAESTAAIESTPAVTGYSLLRNSPTTRRTIRSNFISPIHRETSSSDSNSKLTPSPPENDTKMANIDPNMVEQITNQIMHIDTKIDWKDIGGLDNAKTFIREAAVLPLLRPDLFTGLRKPPRGILLFGPPGTGKTLIGKCIASQSDSTFFTISAATITSKWVGDGEKMVRALFAVAAMHKPAVIFIDEIDSLLSKRSETEHESSRRLKTEFFLQFDGTTSSSEDRILVVGATNRPQELDNAARRRFVRRLYIPLPENAARFQIIQKLLKSISHNLTAEQMEEVANLTDGYSGADIDILCHEAAMQPLRSLPLTQMLSLPADKLRSINIDDFRLALRSVRSSVSQDDLTQYLEWNRQYGSL